MMLKLRLLRNWDEFRPSVPVWRDTTAYGGSLHGSLHAEPLCGRRRRGAQSMRQLRRQRVQCAELPRLELQRPQLGWHQADITGQIKFLRPMSSVSIKVGSSANAGSTARLQVFNAAHSLIGSNSLSLTAAMQTLTVTASGIRYAVLSGPCVVVADDLAYQP